MGAKKFSPADKAAIIVASLGEDLAPEVFKSLGREDASKIGRSLQNLGRLELAEIEGVLQEFLAILETPTLRTLDPRTFLEKLSRKTTRDGVPFGESLGAPDYSMRVFDRTKPELLYRIIAAEKPQTLALILSHAPSGFAALLLKHFPEAQRLDILIRMAKLQSVDPLLIQELDDFLIRELDKQGHSASQKIGGVKKVAEILNALNQEAPEMLQKLSERNAVLAADIQQEMFTFDDLMKIDVKGIAEILKIAKRESLILAMRGPQAALIDRFAAAMSSRSAAMFREDIQALGAQKKSDVMRSREAVLEVARDLIAKGTVQMGEDKGDYV